MRIRNSSPQLIIADDFKELTKRAAQVFDRRARQALEIGDRFCVGVQQDAPPALFELLRSHSRLEPPAWRRTHLFWVDQHCDASSSHHGCNDPMTGECAARVNLPRRNVHRICAQCRNCEFAASAYEHRMRDLVKQRSNGVPQFDLLLLQMDRDGCIASLAPDTYAFYESQRLVWVTRFTGTGITHITVTHPVLHAASHIGVVVSGYDKAVALRDTFTAEPDVVRYPAHALWPVLDKVTWLADRTAARLLPPSVMQKATWDAPKRTDRLAPSR